MTRFPFNPSSLISWKSSRKFQQTLAQRIEKSGIGLHSGKSTTVTLWPEMAGKGRYFDISSNFIPASIDCAEESPLCTTLSSAGIKVRTVEHLLSALEASGVDNCRVQIATSSGIGDHNVEVPILDGSAREWTDAIEQTGLQDAVDQNGNTCERMIPFLIHPTYVKRNDSFLLAFPSPSLYITCGINFPEVPHIGCQWFQSAVLDKSFYNADIVSSRTFCVYEEIEKMQRAGLIKGGTLENAIVCSVSKGWLNPPLRFPNEACRHKVLDLIGDLSLFARCGSQGLPVAYYFAYKAGHALHADLVRQISKQS